MIALGSDHAGFPLKEEIKKYLEEKGIEYKDYGCYTPERFDYAIAAQKACDGVVSGECDKAVLCCGTGIGISIAANRYHGIRAALLYSDDVARLAHEHNNANVVVFGGRTMTESECFRRMDIFLQAKFEGGRHERRLEKIEQGC